LATIRHTTWLCALATEGQSTTAVHTLSNLKIVVSAVGFREPVKIGIEFGRAVKEMQFTRVLIDDFHDHSARLAIDQSSSIG
jgi:hypothetical protein